MPWRAGQRSTPTAVQGGVTLMSPLLYTVSAVSNTSLKLPDELQARLRTVAEARHTSAHAFMLESLQDAVVAAEQQLAFLADAEAAYEQMCESDEGYETKDVHRYINDCARGESAKLPQPKRWSE